MAAITPKITEVGTAINAPRKTSFDAVGVSDGDTITITQATTLLQATGLVANSAPTVVTMTVGTNIITIGVHIPPLVAVPITGIAIWE